MSERELRRFAHQLINPCCRFRAQNLAAVLIGQAQKDTQIAEQFGGVGFVQFMDRPAVLVFQLPPKILQQRSHRGVFDAFDVTAQLWCKRIDAPRLWCYHER